MRGWGRASVPPLIHIRHGQIKIGPCDVALEQIRHFEAGAVVAGRVALADATAVGRGVGSRAVANVP
jgi:hypothetical protein